MDRVRNIKNPPLVESMLTVAVAALVITVGIPIFTEIKDRNRLRNVAETLYADLQYARITSIKQNRPVRVSFNTTKGCYGLDDDLTTTCDCDASPASCAVQDVQNVISIDTFQGITLAENFVDNDIMFDPVRGTLQNLNDNLRQATVKSSQGNALHVVLSFVGQVRICTTEASNLWGCEKCPPGIAAL